MKICSVEGCESAVRSRELCNAHYQKYRRAGGEVRVHARRGSHGFEVPHGTPQGYNYHRCRCDTCKDWNFTYQRTDMLRKNYGMTVEDYDRMFAEQGNACAICRREWASGQKYFSVDHCHDTGQVRGILCNPCNQALGLLGDDADTVMDAWRYLLTSTLTRSAS